jgi:hypothetical protein
MPLRQRAGGGTLAPELTMAQQNAVSVRRVRMPVRSAQLGDLLDTFLVCGAAAIVILRVYLAATGYPKLGGGGLHIAHVLWGGLAMAVAIGILLSFLSQRARVVGAAVGGAGFGTFIDELGKFLTADNNYFFKPTAALIYVVFVICFLAARRLSGSGRLSPVESVANAVEVLREAAGRGLDPIDRDRALAMLAPVEGRDRLAASLRDLLMSLPVASRAPSAAARIWVRLHRLYLGLVETRWFRWAVVAVFSLQAASTVLAVAVLGVVAAGVLAGYAGLTSTSDMRPSIGDVPGLIGSTASLISGGFVVAGVVLLWRSRLRAYRAFEVALLIDLLLVQPFSLLASQFAALSGVIFDLLLLGGLRYLLEEERTLLADAGPSPEERRGTGLDGPVTAEP